MAHAQKPDFVFRRNERVHLNQRGRQSNTGSRGVHISGSNTGCTMFRGSVRVLATHSIRQFPLHFPSSHFNWTVPCMHYKQAAWLAAFDHKVFLLYCMVRHTGCHPGVLEFFKNRGTTSKFWASNG
jgi:hypothetical protein